MSESPKEESKKPSAGDHESRIRVFRYLSILFAAAFLLLLLAFLMQNRTNQEAISDLTESVTSVQNVIEENKALRQQVETLEQELEDLNQTYLDEVQKHQELIYEGLRDRESPYAMDYFWQLEQAYLRGQYALCRELIEKLEQPCDYKDAAISSHLLDQNYFNEEKAAMAERYQQIKEALD